MVGTLHLGLKVSDLDRSLSFYTALGYEVVGQVPETELGSLTMLKLPRDEFVAIELVHDRVAPRPVQPAGISHFVIQADDVRTTVARLAARGIQAEEPRSPDDSDDFWTVMLADPDGYRIELVQWPDGHPTGMIGSDFEGPGQQ